MRQRGSNLFPLNVGLSSSRHDHGDDDSRNSDSHSDPEESILAAHSDEETGPILSERETTDRELNLLLLFLKGMKSNQTKWAQCVTIAVAALATFSYHTVGATANVQVAIMTIITLVGASPFCKTHLTTTAIGAFVGGQNIIGANSREDPKVADTLFASYLWILVLSGGVGLVWSQFVTHPRIKLLDGYAGRLGTTTFIGMNLVMVVLWGPLGVVGWNRYWYGFVDVVHVAEEDSAPPSLADAWSWTEEAELAIGYVLAVLWLGVLSGVTRLKHHQQIREWHNQHDRREGEEPPAPLNNVLVPVLWSLLSILIANATGYKHAAGLYNGFAVGAYVGMASLQKIPSATKFATVSLVAAGWGLTLTPFCFGFAGKSGFTSMMGHITHDAIEIFLGKKIVNLLQRKQRLQQQQEVRAEEVHRLRKEEEEELRQQQQQEEEEEKLHLLREEEQQAREAEEQRKEASKPPQEPYHPPHKPSRKKEQVFFTKQQRRAQQRLRQQQQKQELEQQQQQDPKQGPTAKVNANGAPLRHRAWVATPADGDDVWVYEGSTPAQQASRPEVV